MKIVHTELELRLSGIERMQRAVRRVRRQTQDARLRFGLYAVLLVAAMLLVLMLWGVPGYSNGVGTGFTHRSK